jgi:hypothetical protein
MKMMMAMMAQGGMSPDGGFNMNNLAKDTKIVSKGLDALGYKDASSIAGNLGYGKKKKRKTKGAGRKPRVKLF